jgi:hypothetical protein
LRPARHAGLIETTEEGIHDRLWPDLDTLLTALYVEIDDHVIPSGRRGRGRPKRLSDAELVCLAVAQVLLGARSEHHWLRLCYARLGHLFPYLPHQPGYHKRLKAAAPLLAAAMDHLARQTPSWHDQVRLIDATPLPCGTSRETVKRSELAGWAGYGYCAAHHAPANPGAEEKDRSLRKLGGQTGEKPDRRPGQSDAG